MRLRRGMAAALAVALAAGCSGLSEPEAIALVREYDRTVSDAYRLGDARLVESVAGPAEATRLTALIGVKLDMGITLDATLLELRPIRVERDGDAVLVSTEERWTYLDRRIGTGEQVGPDSRDEYSMRYRIAKVDGAWKVERADFAARPRVGRVETFAGDFAALHGVASPVGAGAGGAAAPPEGAAAGTSGASAAPDRAGGAR